MPLMKSTHSGHKYDTLASLRSQYGAQFFLGICSLHGANTNIKRPLLQAIMTGIFLPCVTRYQILRVWGRRKAVLKQKSDPTRDCNAVSPA